MSRATTWRHVDQHDEVTPIIGAIFLEGTTEDGQPQISITGERPERVQGISSPLEKDALEQFRLRCFQADDVLRLGRSSVTNVRRGDDPPDFYALNADGAAISLDCAAWADHHHRLAYRLMEALREKLIQASTQRDLSGVASCVVAVWFGNRVDSLPPKQRDSSIVEPLLDAISSCRISVDAVNELNRYIAEKGFPQVMPPLIETRTLDNAQAGFVVNLVADPKAGHKFASGLPFELSLARQTTHTGDSVRALIQRIVDQHDKP